MTDPRQDETRYRSSLAEARHDLQRFFREDGANYFDRQTWNGQPNLADGDVDALLDQGASGLEWFRRALIRYHRAWDTMRLPGFDRIDVPATTVDGDRVGAETIDAAADPEEEIARLEGAWYDRQRGLNLASLADLASKISDAARGSGAQPSTDDLANDLTGVANALPEAWQGPAGAATQDYLAGFHAHAHEQNQYLQALSAALPALPATLLQIVRDKASFIAGFDTAQCPVAGHAMRLGDTDNDPVSVIITVAADTIAAEHDFSDVETQFNIPYQAEGRDSRLCRDWLVNHFKPAVREAFIAFVHQCALADHYIRRAYQPVMDLLDNHDPQPFSQPQRPGPLPLSTVPGPAVAEHISDGHVMAAAEPTAPAAPAAVARPPDSPLPSIGGLAEQGVAQMQSLAQQGINQFQSLARPGSDELPGNPATPGADPHAPMAEPAGSPVADLSRGLGGSMAAKVAGADDKAPNYPGGAGDDVPSPMPGGPRAPSRPGQPSTAGLADATTSPVSTPPADGPVIAPMGMPAMGGGGGKGEGDRERRSKGIVPPRPMWWDGSAANDSVPAPPPAVEQVESEAREHPIGPDSASGGRDTPPIAAEPPAAPPPPPRRTDGVKIEIDMGDAK